MKPMDEAPRIDSKSIVVLTAQAAHQAAWDGQFSNFWSNTASRALAEEEALGWMSEQDWRSFVLGGCPK